ncbi:MAG: hypothetical protein HRU19_30855 [Pseudobacteriovorax sp.]|nr:hypothetical protein [Pseudobacteriovorax sp.]
MRLITFFLFLLGLACGSDDSETTTSADLPSATSGTLVISPTSVNDGSSLYLQSDEYPLATYTFVIDKIELKSADGDWETVLDDSTGEEFEFVGGTGPDLTASIPAGTYSYLFIRIKSIRYARGSDITSPECDEETMDLGDAGIGGILVTADLCTELSGQTPNDLNTDANDDYFWVFNGVTIAAGEETNLVFTIPDGEINDQSNHRACGTEGAPGKPTFFVGTQAQLSEVWSADDATLFCE